MAAVSVRNLPDDVKEQLRVRAARNGRSLEAEIRHILTDAVGDADHHLGRAMLETFGPMGGVEVDLPERRDRPRSADVS